MTNSPQQIGRYRILAPLGRGAMGMVYRAEDPRIGRVVALKVVPRPGTDSTPQEHEAYLRFLREARAAGTFSHPNVVTVHDVGEDEEQGLSYIAMEYLDGTSLDRLLRAQRALALDKVLDMGAQVADGLEAAHRAGVIHRDIKPANLILLASGHVKITDFGIAKLSSASMTQDGTFLGSPSYMSPEQVRASEVDHRTDLYSLGTVLYELLSRRQAFPGASVFEVIGRVVKAESVDLATARPDLPGEVIEVVRKAMARDRDRRFPSAAAMAEALRQVRDALSRPTPPGHVTVPVAPPAGTATTRRFGGWWPPGSGSRRRALVVLVAALAALLGTLLLRSPGRPPDAPASVSVSPSAPPSPAPSPRPSAAPSAEASPSPPPRPAPAGPLYLLSVRHRHDFGHCEGYLLVYADRLEYNSRDKDSDDQVWAYGSIKNIEVRPDRIQVETGDRRLGIVPRRYLFNVTGGQVPLTVRRHLLTHVKE